MLPCWVIVYRTLPHWLYVPEETPPAAGWPLVVFLHGIGERGLGGAELDRATSQGAPRLITAGWKPPLVMVAPQCPPTSWWLVDDVLALAEQVASEQRCDRSRVYLTGLSMGGHGAWAVAAAEPGRFAALVPICGPELSPDGDWDWPGLARIPTWVFHGAADPVVTIGHSRRMIERLRAAGGDPRLTVYPALGHDAWTRAYSEAELWRWMLARRLP